MATDKTAESERFAGFTSVELIALETALGAMPGTGVPRTDLLLEVRAELAERGLDPLPSPELRRDVEGG